MAPDYFDSSGDRDVTQPLWPGADHAAGRVASLGGGHDLNPPLAEGKDLGALAR